MEAGDRRSIARAYGGASGDRGGRGGSRAQPHAGAGTPDLRPHGVIWAGVGLSAPAPLIPAPRCLQFLLDGLRQGERCLYITLSESKRELLSVADRHGWSLDGLEIYELVPPELSLDPKQQQSLVYASDLELGETVNRVLAEVERVRPSRVVFDSLSEIRLLSQGSLRYRRQVLALKHFFLLHNATVLLLDDLTAHEDDLNLHSLSHAIIHLEQLAPTYGAERQRIRVIKMRGVHFRGGYHDFVIRCGGLQVFPRLVAAEHHRTFREQPFTSGVAEFDTLLGGGLDPGTSTLLIGPSGVGKSSLALGYVYTALTRGERALVVSFDETRHVLLKRAAGIGMDLSPHLEGGRLRLEQIDPADLSPGEFSGKVRDAVENGGCPGGRDRQSERVPERHAGRAVHDPADA